MEGRTLSEHWKANAVSVGGGRLPVRHPIIAGTASGGVPSSTFRLNTELRNPLNQRRDIPLDRSAGLRRLGSFRSSDLDTNKGPAKALARKRKDGPGLN